MHLVCPFSNKLCNSTLLITEHLPARTSLCCSSPRAQQGPSCLRCCCSVLGGGTGLGTELPGGSTCADTKSFSWATFPAELVAGRKETAAAAHLAPQAARPDLRHQMCWSRSPRELLVSREQPASVHCWSPQLPRAVSLVVQPHAVIPVPYGPLFAELNSSSLNRWHLPFPGGL